MEAVERQLGLQAEVVAAARAGSHFWGAFGRTEVVEKEGVGFDSCNSNDFVLQWNNVAVDEYTWFRRNNCPESGNQTPE